MKAEIKERIEDINKGIAPKGYKTSKLGIIPEDWDVKHFEDVAVINPSKENLDENEIVSFITMSDVSDDAKLIGYQPKLYKEVSNGFTAFKDRDVLVAKITPCFENGKGALVDNLLNKTGFGSTEFHVLRPKKYGDEVYIYYHTITDRFRKIGEKNMTGTAGQKRISADFVRGFLIPYPRNDIERKKITDILSTWDKAIELKEKLIEQKKEQKKGLMQRLLTGKVRLPGFEGEWEEIQVKDVCEIGRGRVISKKEIEQNQGIYPVYSSQTSNNGEIGRINTYDYDGEYITWTTDGVNAGTVFYRKGKFNCTNVCGTLKLLRHDIDARYFSLMLQRETDKYVVRHGNPKLMNNVMAIITVRIFNNYEYQKFICDIFDMADREITLLEQEVEALKQQKKGLMQLLLTGKVRVKC